MAMGWLKSVHCKANVLEDVFLPLPFPHCRLHHKPKPEKPPPSSPASSSSSTPSSSAKKNSLLPLSCGNTSLFLRDVIPPSKPPPVPLQHQSTTRRKHHDHQKQKQSRHTTHRRQPTKPNSPSPLLPASASPFATLTALPHGHSSRRVVEIIFSSSWSLSGTEPFPGKIEMLFKVHNPARTVARFEEYRDAVRSRSCAGNGDARCAADGNEMMRFHSAEAGRSTTAAGEVWSSAACSGGGIRTFAGSAGARGGGGGGGRRRRAMLVCRVIAGRVRTVSDPAGPGEFDSVAVGKGELLVFDPRAVLPCFLIIYKV